MPSCYKCSEPFLEEKLAFDTLCAKCSSWLHCCANCIQYDEYTNTKCREPKAPYVYDRQGKNECRFFRVRQVIREEREKKKNGEQENRGREAKAREGLRDLFKT
jgi:hypothetical protein